VSRSARASDEWLFAIRQVALVVFGGDKVMLCA